MQGHGGHWECLYEDVGFFVQERLREFITKSPLLCSLPWMPSVFDGQSVDTLHVFLEQAEDIRTLSLVFGDSQSGKNVFASAYPFAVRGVVHRVEIERIEAWDYGMEGTIEGHTSDGAGISFFDPLFFLNKDRYEVGQSYDFTLAGLCYDLRAPDCQEILITEGPMVDIALKDGVIKDRNEPVRIRTDQMAAFLPQEDWGIGEHSFQAPVKDTQTTEFDGRTIASSLITVMRDVEVDNEDFDIIAYAADHVLREGAKPVIGKPVSGAMWLQGHLTGSIDAILSNKSASGSVV